MVLLLVGLFIIALIFIGFGWYIIHYLLVKLPEQQRIILEMYTMPAIKSVKQQYLLFNDEQQHHIAVEKMHDIFKEFNIQQPGDESIDAKVRASMYTAWKEDNTLEKLRDDIEKMKTEIETMMLHAQTSPKMPAIPVIEVTKVRDTEGMQRI